MTGLEFDRYMDIVRSVFSDASLGTRFSFGDILGVVGDKRSRRREEDELLLRFVLLGLKREGFINEVGDDVYVGKYSVKEREDNLLGLVMDIIRADRRREDISGKVNGLVEFHNRMCDIARESRK